MRTGRAGLIWPLFVSFLRIAPSSFGGGYAMIPIIEREIVQRRKWVTEADMADITAISGSAPGGVGVNIAAFIGFRLAGISGAAAAVLGMMLPPFIIAFGLSAALSHTSGHPKIDAALRGILAGVVGLMLLAVYRMGRKAIFDKTTLGTAVAAVMALLLLPIHPAWVVAAGLCIGGILVSVKRKLGMPIRLDKEETQEKESDSTPHYIYPDYFIADGI